MYLLTGNKSAISPIVCVCALFAVLFVLRLWFMHCSIVLYFQFQCSSIHVLKTRCGIRNESILYLMECLYTVKANNCVQRGWVSCLEWVRKYEQIRKWAHCKSKANTKNSRLATHKEQVKEVKRKCEKKWNGDCCVAWSKFSASNCNRCHIPTAISLNGLVWLTIVYAMVGPVTNIQIVLYGSALCWSAAVVYTLCLCVWCKSNMYEKILIVWNNGKERGGHRPRGGNGGWKWKGQLEGNGIERKKIEIQKLAMCVVYTIETRWENTFNELTRRVTCPRQCITTIAPRANKHTHTHTFL